MLTKATLELHVVSTVRLLMTLNSYVCIIKDAGQMASVPRMYEHARGTLKHRHKLELDKKKEHTHLISTQLNSTQRYSMMLKDFIIISDDSDGDDSSKTHGLSSVPDNETLIHGFVEVSQEVDQEFTSHLTKTLEPVESHHLASSSRTIRLKDKFTRALARGPVISRGSNAAIPRRPYRSQRMRATNDPEVIEEKRNRTTKMCASSKGKKSAPRAF
uniref:Late blight resistance protein n=1 Tax=Solanum tuberosum TaxID=4113 RepID=M1DHP4_SOLTU